MNIKVAVNKDGSEWAISGRPIKKNEYWDTWLVKLPLSKGTIETVLGCKLTWSDQPQSVPVSRLFLRKKQA